jgi:hypothetical protein
MFTSRKTFLLLAHSWAYHGGVKKRAAHDFQQAQWRAFIQDIFSRIRRKPTDLLPFAVVRERLCLGTKVYLGLKEIQLNQIVGSVNRYQDFTRTFMPRKSNTYQRWERIDSLADKGGWRPIQVYKVSDVYFVLDGNHRVSVAQQLRMDTLEAEVWEYSTRVPLKPDDNLIDIYLRRDYLTFLDNTRLNQLCPEQSIILTVPHGYQELEEHILVHHYRLNLERNEKMPWSKAVINWYDTVYVPLANKIQTENILSFFPDKTISDLVVLLLRHQEQLLRRHYNEGHISIDEAIKSFVSHTRSNLFCRTRAWIKGTLFGKSIAHIEF